MNAYVANLDQIESWFYYLAKHNQFFFPEKTEAINYQFAQIDDTHHFDFFSYTPTILPPIKKIFPDGEILFTYHNDEQGHYSFHQGSNISPQILAGVRPCDLKAIHLMDQVFSDGIKDTHYLQRRDKTTIIAFNCLQPCDDHCFCETVHSLDFDTGADIIITPLSINNANKTEYLIEITSTQGEQLAQTLTATPCDTPDDTKKQAKSLRPKPFGRQFVTPLEQLSTLIHSEDADDIYDHYAQRCFSCGTCNLVCPTCYCFETKDDFALDGKSGQKTRHWDACLNPGFAEVAGGHNFRAEAAARQRHRVRRKFTYLSQRFSEDAFCTGCGRCGRQCTTDIDIFDIVNDVCQSVAAPDQKESGPEAQK